MTSDREHPPFEARTKLGEEVTKHLRDLLMTGAFAPEQRLSPADIGSALGVSTTPVREALATLAHEGLLDALPRRGYRVRTLSRTDVEDVFMIHTFVAGILAERAASVITPETLDELERIQAEMERELASGARSRVGELHYNFHRMINMSVNAERMLWHLRAAMRYIPRGYYDEVAGWHEAALEEHPAIIEALRQRDGARARRLTEEHMRRGASMILAHFDAAGYWDETHGAAVAAGNG